MKARLGDIEVEGTPEEIGALIRAMRLGAEPGPQPPASSARSFVAEDGHEYVSEEVAFKAIKRRALSGGQQAVLRTLKANNPDWTLATILREKTGYNSSQLAGLFGAFGKRVASTEGYRAGSWFFEQEWDYEKDCYKYRLPAGVFAAATRAGL